MRRTTNWRWSGVWLIMAAFLTLALLSGCERGSSLTGSSGPLGAAAAGADVLGGPGETVEIHIRNFRFNPGEVRVRRGTRVMFVNEDDVEHNILQSDGHRVGAGPASFESPVLHGGQRWSKVMTSPGEYPIICTVDGHLLMGMVGTIIVEED